MNSRRPGIAEIAIILVALVVLFAWIGSSCGDDDGLGKTVIDIADVAPQGTANLTYLKIQDISGDAELQEVMTQWEMKDGEYLKHFGFDTAMVEHISHLNVNQNILIMIRSRQDMSDLRNELEELGYEKGDFGKNHDEVWESPSGTEWISITDKGVIIGNKETVMSCIYVRDGASSFSDNEIVEEVLDKLTEGMLVHIETYDGVETYAGLEIVGASLDKKDSQSFEASFVYTFGTPEQASAAMDPIYYAIDEIYNKPEIKQDGKLIVLEAEIEIELIDIWNITGMMMEED
ncbi:MAG: hypothetical protein SVY53_06085 [Chloroflexota bacterium]|nr:hypothetical protein [Chloroflexota bacterium]